MWNEKLSELVNEATSFRFDGSDLMPGEVGTGTFWTGMIDYVSGSADLDTILPEIDASWPAGVAGQVQEEAAAEEPEGEPTFLDRAMTGEFAGTEVNIMRCLSELTMKCLSLKRSPPFEEATGIDINVHAGTKEFETQIAVRIDAGDPPDIAMVPAAEFAGNFCDRWAMCLRMCASSFPKQICRNVMHKVGWTAPLFAGPDGEPVMAGVWYKAANKDLVWYPKAKFDEAGYEVPTTWDELLALDRNDQI